MLHATLGGIRQRGKLLAIAAENPADFEKCMRRIVGRYRAQVHSWELSNEPDNKEFWLGTLNQFATLLRAGAEGVRQADGSAKIVMGGLAWNVGFLEGMLTNEVAMAGVNVVNLHNYYETWHSEPLERIPEYLGREDEALRLAKRDAQLWMAEVGYSSYRRGAEVSGQVRAFYSHEHTPELQAASLFRVLTMLAASGNVELATWYRINDLPQSTDVIGDVNNRHLGVLTRDRTAKPALHALAYFNQLFSGGFRCIDARLRILKSLKSEAVVHGFELPGTRLALIGWLPVVVPGNRGDLTGTVRDSRREAVEIFLPARQFRSADFRDEIGVGQKPSPVLTARQSSTVRMNLVGGKVCVVVLTH